MLDFLSGMVAILKSSVYEKQRSGIYGNMFEYKGLSKVTRSIWENVSVRIEGYKRKWK